MCQLEPLSPIAWSPQPWALLGLAHGSATLAWHVHHGAGMRPRTGSSSCSAPHLVPEHAEPVEAKCRLSYYLADG